MFLFLKKEIVDLWGHKDPFVTVQRQQGEIFREKEGRRTLRFALGEKYYFLKLHQGTGWKEIVKNLLQFKLPVVSAKNEWLAVKKIQQLGLSTMTVVGYGHRGLSPASRLSFIITEEISNTCSLEELCAYWIHVPPSFSLKHRIILQVANIAQTLHENNVIHRDFYLCHFLIDIAIAKNNMASEDVRLYVIDLHRTQLHRRKSLHWIIKDIGSLYFSALDINLTARDVIRFMCAYSRKTLRELMQDHLFWLMVEKRAKMIYRRDFRREAVNMPFCSNKFKSK